MKVCFMTDTVFNLGGIQRVVSVLASELVTNYDVTILCINGKYKINNDLYNLNKKTKVIIKTEMFQKSFFTKVYSKILRMLNEKNGLLNKKKCLNWLVEAYYPAEVRNRFINYFNSNDYDVIVGIGGDYSLLLSIIADKLRAKTIGWHHNSYDAYFKTPNRYHWNKDELFKAFMKKLNKCVVLTDYDKELIDKNFMIKSQRIYNPLSFNSEEKSNCDEKKIICVGRLAKEQKGLDLLIEAFNKAQLKHEDWELYIVGDGEDKAQVNELINSLHLENKVKIEPSTNNIKEYYINSSILVSSSRWEGFGLVITEAMECGLPVIAFANSGPKEIINKSNENGILVPCWSVDILAEEIIGLIEKEEKRKRIGKEASVRAKDFSINKIYEEWNTMLQNIE